MALFFSCDFLTVWKIHKINRLFPLSVHWLEKFHHTINENMNIWKYEAAALDQISLVKSVHNLTSCSQNLLLLYFFIESSSFWKANNAYRLFKSCRYLLNILTVNSFNGERYIQFATGLQSPKERCSITCALETLGGLLEALTVVHLQVDNWPREWRKHKVTPDFIIFLNFISFRKEIKIFLNPPKKKKRNPKTKMSI